MKRKTVPGEIVVREAFFEDIRQILTEARQKTYRAINFAMVNAYWHVGKRIVKEEQVGKKRAQYGTYLIRNLSERLIREFGEGFTEQNLRNFRQFYSMFPQGEDPKIRYTLRSELAWSHYRLLMRIGNSQARLYYMNEAADSGWSARALERQIHSHYYERLLSSKNKGPVRQEAAVNIKRLQDQPGDFIKDPYVLEFLKLKPDASYQEKDLEQALISQLQKFLLELGRGFSFVARQQRICTETAEFYVDLIFYNYVLKCFVLIDLKIGELRHQDIGQMDMYVRLYEDKYIGKEDNPTIGIILCAEKDETIVKYSVLKDNKRLFASQYKLYLPSEKELSEELKRERFMLEQARKLRKSAS